MRVSRISWVFLIIFEAVSISHTLTGDHVCPRTENYTVTSYETYTEPVVVNTFTWCLQIPPRCPKTLTELRQRYRVKSEKKSKTIEECCEGYKMLMIHGDPRCLPFCENCLAGVCIAPNECQCNPGYHGEDCSLECPSGSWGPQCMGTCNCGENGTCDPVNGACRCSPGQQGPRCGEIACAIGRWGADCANECTCRNQNNDCNAVTGRCTGDDDDDGDGDDVSLVGRMSPVYLPSSTSESAQTSKIGNVEYTEVVSAPRGTTERLMKDIADNWTDTNYLSETTTPVSTSIPSQKATTNETQRRDPSTTSRPVIVLVSVPERKRDAEKNKQKFPAKDVFLRHVHNDESIGVSSDIDYVKSIHKDDIQTPTLIPLDIALIVVAAIVSLGLTSLAVVMLLHVRSKLFETVRLAVYDDDRKSKSQERESANIGRMSTVMNSTLPPLPIHANPGFTGNAEPEAILTVNGIESLNTYANGTAAIGLRISGNLRDLLQDDHYDRPATLICLQTNLEQHNGAEHVYDEIPLQISSQYSCKDL